MRCHRGLTCGAALVSWNAEAEGLSPGAMRMFILAVTTAALPAAAEDLTYPRFHEAVPNVDLAQCPEGLAGAPRPTSSGHDIGRDE